MIILLLAFLLCALVGELTYVSAPARAAIRTIIATVGLVLWVLHALGLVVLPRWVA